MEGACLYALKSACSCLVSQAVSSAAKEMELQEGVKEDAMFLAEELEEMDNFLAYVDRNGPGELVAEPGASGDVEEAHRAVEKFRDMARDITDCLRDLAPHRERPSIWRLQWASLASRHSIAAELKELKTRVQEMTTRKERYQRARDRAAGAKPALLRPVEEEARPVAPEIDWRVDLGHLIARPDKSLTVISVWLMKKRDPGGRGSRAISLIGEVYNGAAEFMCRAWVTATKHLSLSEFLRALVRQLLVNDPAPAWAAQGALSVLGETEAMGAEQLMGLVAQHLGERRYLVVVEDVCTRPMWDWIKLIFPDDKNASRIVVTSQRADVARHCANWPSRSFNLERVSDDDARLYISSDKGATTSRGFLEVIKIEPYTEFVGRTEDVEKLTRMISLKNNKSTAFSVYGASGIGKSTLVRNVYDSTELCRLFDRRAWIKIVQPFDMVDFLRETVSQFQACSSLGWRKGTGTGNKSFDDLVAEICQLMEERRSLLVVDGLTAAEEWNQVKSCLWTEFGRNGSCVVIVTTTSEAVASHCSGDSSFMYKLDPINSAAAHQLFYQKVFKHARLIELSKPMVDHANTIIQKCDGNLLAMNIISGLLGTKTRTSAEWEKLLNRFDSELKNHNAGVASAAAKLSYDDLPPHMKYLVQYLSIFPRSNSIMQKRLAKAWLAETYRRVTRRDNVEEIEGIFGTLVTRNIVHPSKQADITSGRINGCYVVDVFRQLCFSEAKSRGGFINILDKDMVNNNLEISQIRHLVVTSGWPRDNDLLKKLNLSWARSLTVFGKWTSCFISPSMKMLRVLDLEDTQGLVEHHDLEHIWEFPHLKYLGLRNTGIAFLPKSLGKLQGLEELDIRGTYIAKLPSTFIHLTRLRCLHGGTSVAACSSRLEIVSENAAASTAFCMCLLSQFQRHKPHGVRVPEELGELKSLLTLGTIDAAGGRSVFEEIQKLTQIQKLGVTGVTKRNSKQLCSTLERLHHLRSLMVHSDDSLSRLDNVSLPPHSVETLKLYGNLGRLPRWIKALHSLLKLCLSATLLDGDAIQIIAKLPKLIVLRLLPQSLVAEEMAFQSDAFPKLELLQLDRLENLMSLSFQRGAVPNLEILEVNNCNFLSEDSLRLFYDLPRIKKVFLGGMLVQKEPYLNKEEEIIQKIRDHAKVIRDAFLFKEAGRVHVPESGTKDKLDRDEPHRPTPTPQ